MKCPKCGYLGFEAVDRCRNCGYDFSLTAPAPLPDLSMRSAVGEDGPLDDLALSTPEPRRSPKAARSAARGATERRETPSDLPLFTAGAAEDVPLITRPSPPRPPLAVRRSTPEVPRLRTEARPSLVEPSAADEPPTLWRPPPGPDPMRPSAHTADRVPGPTLGDSAAVSTTHQSAGLVARTLAGVVDVSLLVVVNAVVVYFTLKICGLTFLELDLLPKVPLFSYFAIQDLGYFAAFTSGGQTLGKMLAGVRVVVDGTDRAPDLPQALLRTVIWTVLALPAGLGLVSVLLDGDKRGLHDRFARTRVVRATV